MADLAEPEMSLGRADTLKAEPPVDAEALSTTEISTPMFDVHLAGQKH
jgi:hypothetical protein